MPNINKYEPSHVKKAYKLALLGLTDLEMADIFEIHEDTFYQWKLRYPDFAMALQRGKVEADANVASRLYKRAIGYKHKAVKIFLPQGAEEPVYADYIQHYPPDTIAASLWLRNRQPDKWRDRREFTGKDGAALIPEHASDLERAVGAFVAALKTTKPDE